MKRQVKVDEETEILGEAAGLDLLHEGICHDNNLGLGLHP